MISEKLKPCSMLTKATILLLLLSQILKTYGYVAYWNFASIPTYVLAFIFLALLVINPKKYRVDMPKELICFFVYWAFIHVVSNPGNPFPSTILEVVLTFILFWGLVTAEQIPRLIKYYKIIALVCIVFFFAQEASYHMLGYRMSGIIQSLPIATDRVANTMMEKIYGARSASFFSEPAYFAQYLIPLLAIELFYDKSKMHYEYSAIILIAILLSRSGSGIIGLMGIVLAFFLNLSKFSKRHRILISIISALFIVAGASFYIRSSVGEGLLERSEELSFDYEGGNRSGFMRLYRGLYVFDQYTTIEKIFGYDNNAVIDRYMMSSEAFNTFSDNDTFYNGYHYCLLRTGFVGLFLMLLLFYRIARHNVLSGECILFSLVSLMAVEAMFFGNNMVLFLIISYRMKQLNLLGNENCIRIKHSVC